MKFYISGYLWRVGSLLIPLWLLVGCGVAQSAPAGQTILTVWEAPVTVTRGDGTTLEPQKDETIEIQVGDHITVGDSGRAMLRYETRLSVELFRGAQIALVEIRQEPDERVFMRLYQDGGHIAVNLSQEARMLLRLENSISILTPLPGSTELLVCQNPAKLTCMAALEGQVEVSAQGEVVTLNPGEATYVLKGAAPEPAICTRPEEIKALEDKMRGTEKVAPLSELVKSLPVENCSQATRQALAPTHAPLPLGEGMVKIDAGEYQVGSTEVDDFHIAEQGIKLEAYWIDAHEVTNAQYQKYLGQMGQAAPAIKPGQEQHPVSGVTWDQAAAYCTSVNKRLPSEAEWEVAGRGPGPTPPLYPWGNSPGDGGKVDELPRVDTYAVGAFDFNQSPFGVYDLAGNVWEWVGEPYAAVAEGMQILHGGRFGYIKDMAYRQPVKPDDERFVPYAGLRCATSQVGGS